MNKSRILFFCGYRAPYGGNFIPSLISLETKLAEKGYQCVYLFPEESRKQYWHQHLLNKGCIVETIKYPNKESVLLKQIHVVCQKYNVGIIHAHFVSSKLMEVFSFSHHNVSVFVHLHSDFSAGKRTFKQKVHDLIIYRFLSSRVKFFSVKKSFVDKNPQRIIFLPNALANNRIIDESQNADIRSELGLRENECFCEMFGWSPFVKGVDVAVESIKQVNSMGYSIKLGIVCGREMTPDRLKTWISENTSCSGDEDYLIFLHPIENVYMYHQAADFLISSSRSEGFSYSILEMLSLGKKCVISNIAGVEWAKKYDGTFFFSSEDVSDCVSSIISSINDSENTRESVAASIQHDYSILEWTNAIVTAYNLD